MKHIRLFLICVLSLFALASCGPNKPDNKAHGTDIKSAGFKPNGVGNAPVEVFDTTVRIEPTWGQANYFARQRGDHAIWNIIAFVLFAAAVVVIYGAASNASWFPNIKGATVNIFLFVLLAGALYAWKWQASSIRWNNDKYVPKAQFDKAIKETGSTKPIWDSLQKECRIVYGPYNCYKK